MLNRAEINRQF